MKEGVCMKNHQPPPKRNANPFIGKMFTDFAIEEKVYFKGEEMKVIAEYERTICAEVVEFPLEGKEEEFPFHRMVLLKDEVEREKK